MQKVYSVLNFLLNNSEHFLLITEFTWYLNQLFSATKFKK